MMAHVRNAKHCTCIGNTELKFAKSIRNGTLARINIHDVGIAHREHICPQNGALYCNCVLREGMLNNYQLDQQ